MNITMKIAMDLVVSNDSQALEILNKTNNDEFDTLKVKGCTSEELNGYNLTIKEIVAEEDGIHKELYKNGGVDCKLLELSRKNIECKDILLMEGVFYILTVTNSGYNLYSNSLCKFYFENNLRSIQEINDVLSEDSVNYVIYKAII